MNTKSIKRAHTIFVGNGRTLVLKLNHGWKQIGKGSLERNQVRDVKKLLGPPMCTLRGKSLGNTGLFMYYMVSKEIEQKIGAGSLWQLPYIPPG